MRSVLKAKVKCVFAPIAAVSVLLLMLSNVAQAKCVALSSLKTFVTGPANIATCVTEDGSLTFHGKEFSLQGILSDQYWICYSKNNITWSVAGYHSGLALGSFGFGPGKITQPGGPLTFPLRVTRETTQGPQKFLIRQTFEQDVNADPDVKVTVSLTYLGPDPQINNVRFVRRFYRSGTAISSDTAVSALGWNEGSGLGLMLSTLGFGAIASSPGAPLSNDCSGLLPTVGPFNGELMFKVSPMKINTPTKLAFRYWLF